MIYKHIIFDRPFRTSLMVSSLTPHSASRRAASLYVGLKSFAPSGHLRNNNYQLELVAGE
ncbi:hypothetical protein Barb4_01517 [Bacteroidales bacterium Barb4]|nr:hypothetical protein Barb4_01517 [Bacteroidales bacterium Barb4]